MFFLALQFLSQFLLLYDIRLYVYVYVGFLISGLNMLVMMLFFNIFLGSYMVFQVKYSLSFPGLSRCMFYTLYVA